MLQYPMETVVGITLSAIIVATGCWLVTIIAGSVEDGESTAHKEFIWVEVY